MKDQVNGSKGAINRRSFMKKGLATAGATTLGAGMLVNGASIFALHSEAEEASGSLTPGDAAILRFLAAVEIIESDLWVQYAELGGVATNEVPGANGGSAPYINALTQLDTDMPQYISDNAEDEISHFTFLDAYLASKGAETANLDQFRILPSSKATGARQIGRVTNLMQLTVDTSWWTRYRSRTHNPDLDPTFKFPQAVPALNVGQHPAIPRSDADLAPKNHIQAIANTAGFHFAFIEQGGTSLYPQLAQRVTNVEVLRILLSIGPTETAHFQTWHDKAGNAPAISDPLNPQLVFPNLNASPFGGQNFQTNLIMPEATAFLSRKFPACSIVRPTQTQGAAMATFRAFVDDGLFIGQPPAFFQLMTDLAEDADAATRR